MTDSDGFTLVKTKSKKARNRKTTPTRRTTPTTFDFAQGKSTELSLEEEEKFVKQIEVSADDFKATEYFLKFKSSWLSHLRKEQEQQRSPSPRTFNRIVSLGLGKFTSCAIGRAQLAFLISLRDHFDGVIPNKSLKAPAALQVDVFDPVFSDSETRILSRLSGFRVLPQNSEGKLKVSSDGHETTLFYLPHCPKQLTNNLLWSNWSGPGLVRIVLCCNSFSRLRASLPDRVLNDEAGYIQKSESFVVETPLENCYRFADVFNDTSLHSFPKAPAELGQNCAAPEPEYLDGDLEFVRKS